MARKITEDEISREMQKALDRYEERDVLNAYSGDLQGLVNG